MIGETNLDILISTMKPHLNSGDYVFCSLKTRDIDLNPCLFFFRENEGMTIICTKEYADQQGFKYSSVFSWITLSVHSALEAVGLTAAFSTALADASISCNVVAGYFHDHVFVQKEKAIKAIKILKNLSMSRKKMFDNQ